MLDIKFIRENPDLLKQVSKAKNLDPGVIDELLSLDKERRELIQTAETARAEQKKTRDRESGLALKEKFKAAEEKLKAAEERFSALMVRVPNVISPDVPLGKDETENKEDLRSGEIPQFDFEPKNHMELGRELDILDFERGAKVAGFRGYYVKGDGALLEMAVMMYAIQKMASKGYKVMIPPTLVKEFALFGSGYFKGTDYDPEVDEIYQVATSDKEASGEASKDRKFLIGTAEPSLLAYYADEVLPESELPMKLAGFSQCYRSEIGSYSKDVKGLYRVHEFFKVEQVVLAPADIALTDKLQNEMIGISQEMHEELGLPYRRLLICSGDMGPGKYKQYDSEAWLPGTKRWAETGSASNFLDWQSRRLNVKYAAADGEKKFVYMLNNTALPSPRIFIAILENYQTKEGAVRIPKVLQPYIGKEIIEPAK